MRKGKMPAFWNRNFGLYFFGSMISGLGGVLSSFTTGLFFLDMTGSAALMSAYIAWVMVIKLVLTPLMGPIVDRLSKVKVMWVCDYIFGLTDLIAALFLFSGLRGMPAAVVVFINGTINALTSTMFTPASSSMTPLVVEKQHLTQAYSLRSTMNNMVSLFGTVFAAGLYSTLGYSWILLINGLCVAASGVAEMFIRVQEPVATFQPNHFWRDLLDGFRYIKTKPALLVLGGCAVPMNFFANGFFSIVIPFMINTALGLPATVLAASEVGMAVGSIVASVYLTHRKKPLKLSRTLIPALSIVTACIALVYAIYLVYARAMFPMLLFALIIALLFALMGAVLVFLNVPLNASFAAQVEPAYMARVQSLLNTLFQAATPLASVCYGVMIDAISLDVACIISVAGLLACILLAHSQRAGEAGEAGEARG